MKIKYNILAAVAVVALCTLSCDKDTDEPKTSLKLDNSIGTLHSGTNADLDLPEGYRIKSVGDYSYKYDSDGMLTGIYEDYNDDYYDITIKPFTLKNEGDEYTENYNISLNSSGYISNISGSYRWESSYNDDWDNTTINMSYSYNSFGQISSVSGSSNYTYYSYGEKYTGTESIKADFTYDSKHRLKTSTCTWEDKYERETETRIYEYDRDYTNTFFQYTPYLSDDDLGFVEPLAFLGLYGKASSALPTAAQVEEVEFDKEDGDYDEDSWYDDDWGPYTFNSYGAIKSADGESYSYTSIATRSAAEEMEWPIKVANGKNTKRLFRSRHLGKSHKLIK